MKTLSQSEAIAKLEAGKLYTGKAIIEKVGLRMFQDLNASGRIEWKADNTEGNKLYRVNQ
jgi:phage gp46-like protein